MLQCDVTGDDAGDKGGVDGLLRWGQRQYRRRRLLQSHDVQLLEGQGHGITTTQCLRPLPACLLKVRVLSVHMNCSVNSRSESFLFT